MKIPTIKTIQHLLLIVIVGIACLWNINILYLLYIAIAVILLKSSKLICETLFKLAVYSIILPDNYTSIVMACIYGGYVICTDRGVLHGKSKSVLVLILWAAICTTINMVPSINVAFSIMYYLPLVLLLIIIESKEKLALNATIANVLFIEYVATFFNFIKNGFGANVYSDWSTGTFGIGQQVQLCLIAVWGAVYYFYEYEKRRMRSCLVWCILSLIVALSTNSWTVIFLASFGCLLGYIFPIKEIKQIKRAIIFIVFVGISLIMLPRIVSSDIMNVISKLLHDENYRYYRIGKIQVYYDTFIRIPLNDIRFFLFGRGMGYYCSRGALACTGNYIELYTTLFSPSMSQYTQEFILPKLRNAFFHAGSDFGSILYRPYSSILAIMGEMGIIGIALMSNVVHKLLKNKSRYIQVIIYIFLSVCIIENFLEYAKLIIFAHAIIIWINSKYINENTLFT